MVVLLWALLRLPIGKRDRVGRFVLDAATVSITTGIFAWYFTVGTFGGWEKAGANAVPMLLLASLGLIGSLAFVKIAMSGLGGLDKVTIRLLAAGAAVGGAGGGMFPMFIDVTNGLSGSQITIPATMLFIAFAADRQRRAAGAKTVEAAPGSSSLVPYLAIAATDGLLLWSATGPATWCSPSPWPPSGSPRWWWSGRSPRCGTTTACSAGWRPVSSELAHRANHDDLTDLANRALFEQRTREALADARAGTLSLALIDLDDFKAINDRLGHAVGDALLVVVAERLRVASARTTWWPASAATSSACCCTDCAATSRPTCWPGSPRR